MRRIVSTLLFVSFCALPASAGWDNYSLLDVNSGDFYSTSPDGASFNTALIRHNDRNTATGSVGTYTGNEADIFWSLYEPDTVKRSDDRARQSQRFYLMVGFYTWDSSSGSGTWDSTTTERCKGETRVRGSEGSPEEARWKISCRGALEAMGLTAGEAARLSELLPRYVDVERDHIHIRGRGPLAP